MQEGNDVTAITHSKQKHLVIALTILIVSFLLRIFYSLTFSTDAQITGDGVSYIQYAKNLLDYGVYSKSTAVPPMADSFWAPLYPFFLAVCFKIGNLFNLHGYYIAIYAQAFLGALVSALTYIIGRFFLSLPYAVFAAVLTVLSPHLITHSGCILTETLFSLVLLIAVYLYLKALMAPNRISYFCMAGVAFGFAYLANPVAFFIPFLLGAYFLFSINEYAVSGKKQVAVLVGIFSLIVMIWYIRGEVSVSSEQESSSDRAFSTFVYGAHPEYHDEWLKNPRDPNSLADSDFRIYQHDHPDFYVELQRRFLVEPKRYLAWYLFEKPLELWGWKIVMGSGDIYVSPVESSMFDSTKLGILQYVVMKHTHYWFFAAALLGFFFVLREKDHDKKSNLIVIYVVLISISGVYVVLHTDGRYSVPLRPEMYLGAAYTIQKLSAILKSQNQIQRSKQRNKL